MNNPNSRRTFLKKTGVLSVSSMLPLSVLPLDYKYKMGLQLFTIRDAMANDPIGSIAYARGLGYEDGEIYGYDGENDSYYGIPSKEFKKQLDDLDFTISSGHYNFSNLFNEPEDVLMRYVDQCIKGAKTLQSTYITWPWLAPEYRTIEHFKILTYKLNKIGEQVNNAGLQFAYHNHDFEFTDHNGEQGNAIILAETDPNLVKLQMDMYWVEHSSTKSIHDLIRENPKRYVMWHIKDMDKITRDYSEMGNGSIDYKQILANINKEDLQYYYLEQGGNFAKNSMQSITDSAQYFKKHLQRYL
ncbi:sugar phosphate isomerase/epimerase family protein [Maribacter sp. MAR_2009_72]|uniref:sugar phosphate isomerase/epimerase family protein n=1 Tax=Maribacter sp. MAR_2009_72 TaxID=1250050 RepID=UPI00119BC5E0|nr:sugar phosphate isomerase/epimerase [Maribacter sp. MAR_2009_72]TVZ14268.1 sugar phosphate isomerase/epimerase [Maribacter sp. MAR_2009_72]